MWAGAQAQAQTQAQNQAQPGPSGCQGASQQANTQEGQAQNGNHLVTSKNMVDEKYRRVLWKIISTHAKKCYKPAKKQVPKTCLVLYLSASFKEYPMMEKVQELDFHIPCI